MKFEISNKAMLITLFLIMLAGLIFLGFKAYQPSQLQETYEAGINFGLTSVIQEIQKNGVAVIGLPNNQSFEVTHPSLCGAILEGQNE